MAPLPEPPPPFSAVPAPVVHGFTGWHRLALWPLVQVLRLWGRTLRFEISAEDRRNLEKADEPVAFVLWHNRLFITPEIVRRFRPTRPMYALVSASRDGAWLAAFFNGAGMHTVRGSSSRLGREAATALVGVARAGHDVGITPDGPRGPAYELKPGALIVARRAQIPVMLFGAAYRSAWRAGSWDRFYLPKPWSRVQLACRHVPAAQLAAREEAASSLQAELIAINPD